jgi:nicotinamide-nucleotide amidase
VTASHNTHHGTAVEIVTIGDELLLGFTIDTNAAHLARSLASIGMHVVRRSTVGDDASEIARAVGDALERTGAVITTGGLGPTSDDLSKDSVAALFGRGMHLDEEHFRWMEDRWKKRFNRPLPAGNRRQAMVPDGAEKLENHFGSAPGIWLEDDRGRWVAMLPGVPSEMRGMLADTLLPKLMSRTTAGTVVRSLTLRTTGVAESLLADRIEQMDGGPLDVSLAYLPSISGVDLRLTMRDVPADVADATLARAAERLRAAVGDSIYGENDDDLAATVLQLCRERSLTIGVAESCTGGLVGARLTAVPGSSDVVRGGVVAYHNDLKRDSLQVPDELIREHGAVSEPVARAMAAGARKMARADIGLGVTGIAGPSGGTEEKPVGTVWLAADVSGDVETKLVRLWGDRDDIRQRSAQWLLEMLRKKLNPGQPRNSI